jgi:hypothetical protein
MGKIKISAADLYTGTLEAARFPTTLPAVSGANLTNLDASNLATGSVSASLLPLASGSTRGALIVGSNLTLTSGTVSLSSGNVTAALGYTPLDAAEKAAVNGVASLGADGKIPSAQLPAIAITDTFVVASQSAMLALTAEKGDVAVRTDLSKCFILKGSDATTLANWEELLTPGDAVLSVNSKTGAVTLSTTDISEGTNLYWTTARFDDRLATKTTDNLTEGSSNVYWTASRFNTAFSGKSTSDLTEGTNLYWTNTRFDDRLASANLNADNLSSGTVNLNRLSGITNTQIASDASIAYGKLNLAGNLVNADISASAAIDWTKVSKTGSSLADLGTRSASDLSTGTLPNARFPATLPTASGANLTALNASNLGSGTVPLARLSEITNTEIATAAAIAWSKLDKAGSSLADLATRSASDLSSGTLPDARFPVTLPAVSGVNLTSLNASNLASGTVPLARLSGITNTEISASAAIAWSKLDKTGSSLADLGTRTTANLTDFPAQASNSGKYLTTNGTSLSWGTVSSVPTTRSFAQLVVLGDLNAHAAAGGTHDFFMNTDGAKTLRKIIVSCPATAASGSIVVDVRLISSQGGSATSLFPTKTKPTITCNGGAAWAILVDSSLETLAISDNSMIVVTITSAPAGCTDLRVEFYE